MAQSLKRTALVVVIGSLLSACGGGDKSQPVPTPATTVSSTVGGTVAGSAGTAAAKAAIVDGVAIDLVSYDKNDKVLGRASVTSDSGGGFSAQLNLSTAGGYVVVTATKEGFTEFRKRVDYVTPANIELRAAIESVNVAFANPGSALTAGVGNSSEPSFNFAVLTLADGTRKTVAGSAIKAAKAAGATVETSINIPAASVPGVTKLKGELNAYDPATQSDRFPGSYIGVDAKGNQGKMVSLAFDFLKISDADTGKSLGKLAKELVKAGVVKAAAASTTVTRHIYSTSCTDLFLDDYNKTAAGWQVPVWSLSPYSGKWIFIGEGTVVDANGNPIGSPTAATCSNGNYYLQILVSNTEFANNWWNLDHIVFDTPKEVCLSGKFTFANAEPVKNLSLSLSGPNLDYKWGSTGSDGTFSLSTVLINKNSASRNATVGYYGQDGNYVTAAATVGDSPNCGTYNKTDIPKPCEVSGRIIDSDSKPIPYRYIRLQGADFYRGTSSAGDGTFSSLVKCGTEITAYVGSQVSSSNTFNVDGTASGIESSDNGSKAALADLTVPNLPPTGYLYFVSRSIKTGNTLSANLSAYDEDGNYPIAWTVNIKKGTAVSAAKSGSIDANSGQASADFTGLAAGDYTTELVLTDSKGNPRTINGGNVTVSDGSRPPTAAAYSDRSYLNSCGGSGTITLYGYGYSLEGDSLTGEWTVGGAPVANCKTGSDTPGYLTSTCSGVSVPSSGTTTYTYTVRDPSNGKSGSAAVLVSTFSSTPWVTSLGASPTLVNEGASGTARDIKLTATATNSEGVEMTGSWSVNGAPIAACPNATVANAAQASCTYTVPSTAVKGDSYTFRFTVSSCGKSGYRETKATYGQATDVTIVIQ